MKRVLLLVVVAACSAPAFSQKIDSIYFNLYTDSLKKGQHNYINVDAKMSNGRWVPLMAKDIQFSCDKAEFEGNQLVIPEDFKHEKVTIKAVLKSNPAVTLQRTIWIKQKPDPALPTSDDILNEKKKVNL